MASAEAHDVTDFRDLLAAYDIPDLSSASATTESCNGRAEEATSPQPTPKQQRCFPGATRPYLKSSEGSNLQMPAENGHYPTSPGSKQFRPAFRTKVVDVGRRKRKLVQLPSPTAFKNKKLVSNAFKTAGNARSLIPQHAAGKVKTTPTDGPDKSLPTASSSSSSTKIAVKSTPDMLLNEAVSGTTAYNGSEISVDSDIKCPQGEGGDGSSYDQLETSALPPFAPSGPPPEKLQLDIPDDGYRCLDCGCHFWLEKSLTQHLQRRSVNIDFSCATCRKLLIFYNRCTLLGHIRVHHDRNEAADPRQAIVSPLPKDLIPCLQEQKQPSTAEQKQKAAEPTASTLTTSTQLSSSSSSSQMVSIIIPPNDASKLKSTYHCYECQLQCVSSLTLQEHFGCSRTSPKDGDTPCAKCNMVCPSRCSFLAHQRIHLQNKPFVCPECGQSTSETWQDFQRHLSIVCMHHSRAVGFRCSVCKVPFVAPEQLKEHVVNNHGEAYYKCQVCPMAFRASAKFESHRLEVHPTDNGVQCTTIRKCPLCDVVFQSNGVLDSHLESHLEELIKAAIFVFSCVECGVVFENKAQLSTHLQLKHPDIFTFTVVQAKSTQSTRLPPPASTTKRAGAEGTAAHTSLDAFQESGSNAAASSNPQEARKRPDNSRLDCLLCSEGTFSTKHNLAKHLENHASTMVYPLECCSCGETLTEVNSALDHWKKEHGLLSLQCNHCDAQYLYRKSLMRHIRTVHRDKRNQLPRPPAPPPAPPPPAPVSKQPPPPPAPAKKRHACPHCERRDFSKSSLLRKHIAKQHAGKLRKTERLHSVAKANSVAKSPRLVVPPIKIKLEPIDIVQKGEEHEEEEDDEEEEVEEKGGEKGDQEKERDEAEEEEPGEEGATLEQTDSSSPLTPPGSTGTYACAKCSFATSEGREKFLRHIAQHKSNQESFQCLECGTCFMVEPTLKKHLVHQHKVKDVDKYLVEHANDEVSPNTTPVHHGTSTTSHGASTPGSSDDSQATGSGTPIQEHGGGTAGEATFDCHVCFANFDNELALKTHARTHGMAFIRAKRNLMVSQLNKEACETAIGSPPLNKATS